jgi:mannose-6-phosphate isomerase-like protein (cupin superfamily)
VPTIFDELLGAFRAYVEGLADEADFAGAIDWKMPARSLETKSLPCLAHLDRLAASADDGAQGLVDVLARHRHSLRWGQTYTAADFDRRFIDNYGWMELFGTRGHFDNAAVAGGFLILGPGIEYPDHHHVAEELYVPLAGRAEWRKGEGAFLPRAAGEVIHHPSRVNHAMRTAAEPLLALYLWRGGPLAEKSTVTGRAGAPA